MGGTVPKSYYMSYKLNTSHKKSLSIPRGDIQTVEFEIKVAGSVLKYKFL